MAANTYDVGDIPSLATTFKVDDVLTDPTTVRFGYVRPDATEPIWLTYLTDLDVQRDAEGVYHVDLELDAAGRWAYRWEGTGEAEGAEERRFYVRRRLVPAAV